MLFIYTDGSVVRPAEGKSPGGWAFRFFEGTVEHARSGYHEHATSQQMEMLAAIGAFKYLLSEDMEGADICIVSDSQYVVYGASRWMENWKKKRWRTAGRKPVKNRDLWEEIDLLSSFFNTKWKWVKGHNGHPQNEFVDKMARAMSRRYNSLVELRNTTDSVDLQDIL